MRYCDTVRKTPGMESYKLNENPYLQSCMKTIIHLSVFSCDMRRNGSNISLYTEDHIARLAVFLKLNP